MMFPNLVKLKVLIWTVNSASGISPTTYSTLVSIYTTMGLTVHNQGTWSGTLSDYGLIHFPFAISDPSWWGEISGNTWAGRLHITAEHNGIPAGVTSIAYVTGKSGITGISVGSASIPGVFGTPGTAETDDLTAGMSGVTYSLTTTVSGGTALSKTSNATPSPTPWLARNKPSGSLIDFVVAGDQDHMVGGIATNNTLLFQNMWNVAA